MPEVGVRKPLGRRPGGVRYHMDRWFYRNRPKIAVMAAFAIACLLGLVAASLGMQSLGHASVPSGPPAATP